MKIVKDKVVIFGTGLAAKRYYEKISALYGKESIVFFLDSLLEKTEFLHKKVFHPEILKQIDKNKFKYVLGSDGSKTSMKNELLKQGVNLENIWIIDDYSGENLLDTVKKIKEILIYPTIKEEKVLKKIIKKINYNVNFIENSNITINFITDFLPQLEKKNFKRISAKEKETLQPDIILVWDNKVLEDEWLRKKENVYCIDEEYQPTRDIQTLCKINYIIAKQKFHYSDIFCQNWEKIWSHKTKKAYLFGAGPSLEKAISILEKDKEKNNSIKIVCNHLAMQPLLLERIKPNLYVVLDSLYLLEEGKPFLIQILDYIKKNECYLVVPFFWIPFICSFEKELKKKIIGFSMNAEDITFPDKDNLNVYYKGGNVITAFAIPIASALSEEIYIGGCDGYQIEESQIQDIWDYSESLKKGIEDVRVVVEKTKIASNVNFRDNYNRHIHYMEEIIAYGEKQGKKYYSLTASHILALSKRQLKDIKEEAEK